MAIIELPNCCKAGFIGGLYDIYALMVKIKGRVVGKEVKDNPFGYDLGDPCNPVYNRGYSRVWFCISTCENTCKKLLKLGWGPIGRIPTHADYHSGILDAQKNWRAVLWMLPAPPKSEQIKLGKIKQEESEKDYEY